MTETLFIIILYSWIAGIMSFIGGLIAKLEGDTDTYVRREISETMVAFGAGVLIAAVAFTLAPEAVALLPLPTMMVTFIFGGIFFCYLDNKITKAKANEAQFMAMLMDFVPESIALGAIFSQDKRLGLLLASFIAIQNLPEGFNAFKDLSLAGSKTKRILKILFFCSFLGPICATVGYLFLKDYTQFTAAIMSFSAGGVLYLVFRDIAPKVSEYNYKLPPFGAVVGFLIGMVAKQFIG